jgi:hypothetical protein
MTFETPAVSEVHEVSFDSSCDSVTNSQRQIPLIKSPENRSLILISSTCHRLQAEILARQGRRRVGGRRPTAADKNNIEAELARNLWAWDRWIVTQKDAIESLRPELQKQVAKLAKQIGKIKAELEDGVTQKD